MKIGLHCSLNKIGILAILLQVLTPDIVLPRIFRLSGPLFAQEAGLSPEHLAFFKKVGLRGMGEGAGRLWKWVQAKAGQSTMPGSQ